MIENENSRPSGFKQFCLNLLHWQVFVPALFFLVPLWYGFLQPMTEWYFLAILAFVALYFSGWVLLIVFAGIGFVVSTKRYWLPFALLLYAPVSLFIGTAIQDKFYVAISFCVVLLIPVTMLITCILIASLAKKRKDGEYNFVAKIAMSLFLILLLSIPPFIIGSYLFNKCSEQFKQEAQVVIEKIDAYHAANQKYPETLKEIGCESETPSLSRSDVLVKYWSHEDNYYIELSKPRLFRKNWIYYSNTKEWVSDD